MEDPVDGQGGTSASVSVVIRVDERSAELDATLAKASSVLAPRVAEYELIVVVSPNERAHPALEHAGVEAVRHRARIFLLTREVDSDTAAWHGIQNARGDQVAVLDAASDDIAYLPELLRRAAGADLVFARATDRTPPRLSRAVARRLLDGVQRSLGVAPVAHLAPQYRVLGRNVVNYIAQHPDPVAAYRRLPRGSSFTCVHLEYSARAAARPRAWERATQRTRRVLCATLDEWSRLQGHDTTFYDPADGDGTICVEKLALLDAGAFELPEHSRVHDTGHYYPANPSIARLGDRTWVNVRLVNYRKQGHGSKISGDGVYRSRNLVFEWNPESGLTGAPRESGGVPASWAQDTRVRGLEDQRWLVHRGRLWFSACCCQVPHAEGAAQMVLGRLNETLDGVDHLVPLRFDAARVAEKNWLLWSVGDELLAIYGYQPFTLLKLDTRTGRALPARVVRTHFPSRGLRGSAGPLPIAERPGHWLVLVHEVVRRFDKPLYAHRWLLIHPELGIVAHSRPFVFEQVGIEYAAGLLDNGDGTLTVSYGVEDREARWARLDKASVLASLYAVRQESAPLGPAPLLELASGATPRSRSERPPATAIASASSRRASTR